MHIRWKFSHIKNRLIRFSFFQNGKLNYLGTTQCFLLVRGVTLDECRCLMAGCDLPWCLIKLLLKQGGEKLINNACWKSAVPFFYATVKGKKKRSDKKSTTLASMEIFLAAARLAITSCLLPWPVQGQLATVESWFWVRFNTDSLHNLHDWLLGHYSTIIIQLLVPLFMYVTVCKTKVQLTKIHFLIVASL